MRQPRSFSFLVLFCGVLLTTCTKAFMVQGKASFRPSLKLGVAAWEAYNSALEADPLIVKSVTAGVILGAADFAGQALEKVRSDKESEKSVDFARAARFSVFGLVLQAPWNHFYYNILDSQIPPTEDPFSQTNIVKIVIDQFIQAPVFTVLIFAFLGFLEGKQLDDIKKQLQNDYPDTIVANCEWTWCVFSYGPSHRFSSWFSLCITGKLWVPATVINIGFVPPIFRVLYLNIVFFFWSIYLSLVLNKDEA